jgi:exodeoxyribonuclease VII large subunit
MMASTPAPETPPRNILTVSRLNRLVHELLEHSFPLLWVEGEVSNFARPASGHWYFTLKDEAAQIRCAMFRPRNALAGITPANGAHVLVRAQLSLYEARGDYQLIVEHIEDAGEGALRRKFEALKKKLGDEGLFDAKRKRKLPAFPRRVGVITSPSGAALRDILSVLRRRFAALPILIYPVPVQGAAAAAQIAQTIRRASARHECDVVILARGGGSLEDLWAFNEEVVARAIAECAIPIVAGIGHETDFTIADFVADVRAPTPSVAAETISPDATELLRRFVALEQRLRHRIEAKLANGAHTLRLTRARLIHPRQRLRALMQRVDELDIRMRRAHAALRRERLAHLRVLSVSLLRRSPLERMRAAAVRRADLHARLIAALRQRMLASGQRVAALSRTLDGVSPLATLERGYAIVRKRVNGELVRAAKQVQPGEQVEAQVAQGRLVCTVNETSEQGLKPT